MAKRPFIAVIDDDPSVREAISDLVAVCGYAVRTFASAESFLEAKPALRASCIILDIQMPGMSGLELNRHLHEAGHAIPTIFITAHPERAVQDRLVRRDSERVFSKPVREEALVACLHRAVAGQSLGSTASEI